VTDPRLIVLIKAWAAAADRDRTADAGAVGGELVPLLDRAGAVDRGSALAVGRYVYWVRSVGTRREVAREFLVRIRTGDPGKTREIPGKRD
jgi:hypothetical protein